MQGLLLLMEMRRWKIEWAVSCINDAFGLKSSSYVVMIRNDERMHINWTGWKYKE